MVLFLMPRYIIWKNISAKNSKTFNLKFFSKLNFICYFIFDWTRTYYVSVFTSVYFAGWKTELKICVVFNYISPGFHLYAIEHLSFTWSKVTSWGSGSVTFVPFVEVCFYNRYLQNLPSIFDFPRTTLILIHFFWCVTILSVARIPTYHGHIWCKLSTVHRHHVLQQITVSNCAEFPSVCKDVLFYTYYEDAI